MTGGKSLRLFLVDGTAGGLVTAEIMNWTGHVVAAPRSDLGALLKRAEAARTGVYILVGEDPDSLGGLIAYVGEGDDVGRRLYQHSRPEPDGKDFWDRAIVMTSKDANLTKAHARYLESRLITVAGDAGRARLVNGTAPPLPALPEADVSDMEYFLDQVRIVLPVLGLNVLRGSTPAIRVQGPAGVFDQGVAVKESPVFEIALARDGVSARAQEIDGEFTAKKGSVARAEWIGVKASYLSLRERLVAEGVLAPLDEVKGMVFTRDQVFASPSAAAAVVLGRASNGRVEWKVAGTATTYAAWQAEQLESSRGGVERGDEGVRAMAAPAAGSPPEA